MSFERRYRPPFNVDTIATSTFIGVAAGLAGSIGVSILLSHNFTQPIPQSRLVDLFLLPPTACGFLATSYAIGKENYRRNHDEKISTKEYIISGTALAASGALLAIAGLVVDRLLFNANLPFFPTGIETAIYNGAIVGVGAMVPYTLGRKG